MPPEEGQTTSTFTGTVTIRAEVMTNTNQIKMHAHKTIEFEKSNVTLKVNDTPLKFDTFNMSRNFTTDFLSFDTERVLKQSELVEITINYKGLMSDNMRGFYLSSYTEMDENNKTVTK